MTDDGFRLPDSSYDVLTKIVRAYGTFNQPKNLSDVGKAVGITETTISSNVGFFVSIAVLEGAKAKQLSDRGRRLARALDYEMPDQIRESWREIVSGNEFLQQMVAAVRIRKGMERSALQAHIASSAGQAKSARAMTGANAVIDILRAAEVIKDEDGKVVAVVGEPLRREDVPAGHRQNGQSGMDHDHPAARPPARFARPSGMDPEPSSPATGIVFQVQIQCRADELEALGPRLRLLLQEISNLDRLDGVSIQEPAVE